MADNSQTEKVEYDYLMGPQMSGTSLSLIVVNKEKDIVILLIVSLSQVYNPVNLPVSTSPTL